ncbi:hypothetical protein [Asanoa sp. NPDC050611]|uniref:hypothetical protein n=1 Tax=Asanoa sp. NPDC050611 TaxID=3157098 RepID=UPI0034097F87
MRVPAVDGTGVVGVLRNGTGPTALLRADMDTLRVPTAAVLPTCGHDVHVTCLLGAAAQLAHSRATWRGTLLLVFRPLALRPGPAFAAADTPRVVLFARGVHGPSPEGSVVLSAATVLPPHGIGSREPTVVTVGSVRAGTAASAALLVSTRTHDDEVRDRLLAAIERILRGEPAPREPEITTIGSFPAFVDDPAAVTAGVRALVAAARARLPANRPTG